jgi:pyrimidine operon attenuation protein / uracil phosphoribosyltransferase
MSSSGQQILSAPEIDARIHRIAFQILENHTREREDFVLIGIHRRGVPLARRLARVLENERPHLPTGSLDITLYHDNPQAVDPSAALTVSEIPGSLDGRRVILIDDVLQTGRTIRAAIGALFDFGRPALIELAVFADRGGRELPIQPNYCGLVCPTEPTQYLKLSLREEDGHDALTVHESPRA